jgi:hypothetical protein
MTQKLPQRTTQKITQRIAPKLSQKIAPKMNQVDLSRFTTTELNVLLGEVLVKLRHREVRRAAQGQKPHETAADKIAKHISERRS